MRATYSRTREKYWFIRLDARQTNEQRSCNSEVYVASLVGRQEKALSRAAIETSTCGGSKGRLSGPRLVRATRPFAVEDVTKSRVLLAQTLLCLVVLHLGIVWAPLWLKPVLATVTGALYIRLFIFYHDFLHGAQLTTSWVTRWMMHGVGYLMLTTTSVWRETHDF